MAWVRLDDGFFAHPKVLAAGDAALGFYTRALAYCAHYMTDGFVPKRWAEKEGGKSKCAVLTSVGLWREQDASYYIPDFLEYNFSADELKERRKRDREAKQRQGQKGAAKRHVVREDVMELCNLLADLVEENGSKRPNVTQRWRDEARLLLDRDKRPLNEAKDLIRWTQSDPFWKSNVMAMPKFRQQYDRLRLQSKDRAGGTPTDYHDDDI